MARSEEYRAHAQMVSEAHPFCVKMRQRLLRCSLGFLYGRNLVPEHQGGRFNKNLPRPTPIPTVPPMIKPFKWQTLEAIEDLVKNGCCKMGCASKIPVETLVQHRARYVGAKQVRWVASFPLFLKNNLANIPV